MNCIVSSTEMLKITHTLTRHTALLLKSFLKHWLKWPRYARIRKVNGPKSNPPNHRSPQLAATRCCTAVHRSAPKRLAIFKIFRAAPRIEALSPGNIAREVLWLHLERRTCLSFSLPALPSPRRVAYRSVYTRPCVRALHRLRARASTREHAAIPAESLHRNRADFLCSGSTLANTLRVLRERQPQPCRRYVGEKRMKAPGILLFFPATFRFADAKRWDESSGCLRWQENAFRVYDKSEKRSEASVQVFDMVGTVAKESLESV